MYDAFNVAKSRLMNFVRLILTKQVTVNGYDANKSIEKIPTSNSFSMLAFPDMGASLESHAPQHIVFSAGNAYEEIPTEQIYFFRP